MHILIGLAIACALLYAWLIGHWFARVLVFLLLAIIGGGALGFIFGGDDPHNTAGIGPWLFGFVISGAVAWFVAGVPFYCWREQLKRSVRAQAEADAEMMRHMKWDPMAGCWVRAG